MFTISDAGLTRLFEANRFTVPDNEMVFFGLRGCLPLELDVVEFAIGHDVAVEAVDYLHPRCSIGQWLPGEGLWLYPGSTVPHRRYIAKALENNGNGTNRLMTGLYHDYRKGRHLAGKPTGHEAFRQDGKLPIRRSADDLDYDQEDRVEFNAPFDNLHAAWSMGTNKDFFASAGCQVVLGFPRCERRGDSPDSGAWKSFKENAYALAQTRFDYLLLDGRDARSLASGNGAARPIKLRYGSGGDEVTLVQQALEAAGFPVGVIDGAFGSRTLFAILAFQTARFGADADDGIVGSLTGAELGIDPWPVG